jgi:molybdopterin molybdotransferase
MDNEMITFDRAFEIVINTDFKTGDELVSYEDSAGRVLAENVASDIDMPPFNKASVDGFACKQSDLANELEIIETIPAGKWPEKEVGSHQCSRIMTGAALPGGSDCVIMVEDTILLPTGRILFNGSVTKENYARKGEDIKKGDIVLSKGKLILPQDIAVLATVGHILPRVSRMPRIAVISTGDELVEPDHIPGRSQIRNSNASQLLAQVSRSGGIGKYYGIVRDNEEETLTAVKKAIFENEILIITGGVSMGDFDFVPSVLEEAGVRIIFSRVAVQPGKPTTFGLHSEAVVFGLPGNPVSAFIQFEMLIKPLIYKMMGHVFRPLNIRLPMRERFIRAFSERLAHIPVKITDEGKVTPVEYHGSAHIIALSETDGIIKLSSGINKIEEGEIVSVRQI